MWEDVNTDLIDEEIIEEGIYSILNQLNPRMAQSVMLYNGYDCTYKEVGETLKVSAARARELEMKGLRILRTKHEKFFRQLDIPWINKYYGDIDLARLKYRVEQEHWNREWHKKCVEDKIAQEKERRVREKLKVKYCDIPKPEMIVKSRPDRPAYFPPHFVKLLYDNLGNPYLHVNSNYGSIHRDLDPETYDRWIAYLIDPRSTQVR